MLTTARLTCFLGLVTMIAGPLALAEGPNPPRQGQPWTPPATSLPKFLARAASILFEQGLADPRGCEYRTIELITGVDGRSVTTHGFVFPAVDGETQRHAVAWSGLVYPLVKVGEPADLAADMLTLKAIGEGRGDFGPGPGFQNYRGRGDSGAGPVPEMTAVAFTSFQPIKICLLLRLGRADLAESIWAAGLLPTKEEAPKSKPDLTTYRVSYLTLANDWAWFQFDRAINAHLRGDDALALAGVRALVKIQAAIEAKAEEMGFAHPNSFDRNGKPSPYVEFLGQLPEFLADQERRAIEPKASPAPQPGADRSARITALIRDLDQVKAGESIQFGWNDWSASPVVKSLIEEGEAAVDPLIEVMRHDNRLTRSVKTQNRFNGYASPQPQDRHCL